LWWDKKPAEETMSDLRRKPSPGALQTGSLAHSHVLNRRIESIARLTDEERHALASLPVEVADLAADQDIVREHDQPSRSVVLLEGFCFSYKLTGEGRRQIVGIFVPGDLPDLQSLHLQVMDSGLSTLTPCRVGFMEHHALRALCGRYPRLGDAFWRVTLIEGSIAREWMTNIGQRKALSRMAHVLCELVVRLDAVGLVSNMTCELPITQSEFADVMGISTVHANRTLQELRGMELIRLTGQRLEVLDWDRLREVGDFDPTFLHIRSTQPR
jgi:CRP-like cAMP-binding protein